MIAITIIYTTNNGIESNDNCIIRREQGKMAPRVKAIWRKFLWQWKSKLNVKKASVDEKRVRKLLEMKQEQQSHSFGDCVK